MDTLNEIVRILGRIEGKLEGISKLPERVSMLEQCQSWMKGAWGILLAGYAFLFRGIYGK